MRQSFNLGSLPRPPATAPPESATGAAVLGGYKGEPGAAPHSKVWPLWPQNEVHYADILTEVYAIASLGLQVQVCQ